jgi:hypothetical protein
MTAARSLLLTPPARPTYARTTITLRPAGVVASSRVVRSQTPRPHGPAVLNARAMAAPSLLRESSGFQSGQGRSAQPALRVAGEGAVSSPSPPEGGPALSSSASGPPDLLGAQTMDGALPVS